MSNRCECQDFCPLCGVRLDLHDGPDSCRSAEMKARVIERFWEVAPR